MPARALLQSYLVPAENKKNLPCDCPEPDTQGCEFVTRMGDSDDDGDYKRRDKFRTERRGGFHGFLQNRPSLKFSTMSNMYLNFKMRNAFYGQNS